MLCSFSLQWKDFQKVNILCVNSQRDNYQYFEFSEHHVPKNAIFTFENENRSVRRVENDTVAYNLVDDVTQRVDLMAPEKYFSWFVHVTKLYK